MGRSVSYPAGSIVAFTETPYEGGYCLTCENFENDCTCEEEDRNIEESEVDWDYIAEDIVYSMKEISPSIWAHEDWAGREDRVVARNNLVQVGFSEYCGLMSVWMMPLENLEDHTSNLAEAFMARMEETFTKTFGTLTRIGFMSNGEGVYNRINS